MHYILVQASHQPAGLIKLTHKRQIRISTIWHTSEMVYYAHLGLQLDLFPILKNNSVKVRKKERIQC